MTEQDEKKTQNVGRDVYHHHDTHTTGYTFKTNHILYCTDQPPYYPPILILLTLLLFPHRNYNYALHEIISFSCIGKWFRILNVYICRDSKSQFGEYTNIISLYYLRCNFPNIFIFITSLEQANLVNETLVVFPLDFYNNMSGQSVGVVVLKAWSQALGSVEPQVPWHHVE